MTLSPAQSVSSTLSESPAQSALWSTLISAMERKEYCKAWAVTKQAVIFFEGIQESLKAWENPADPKYEDEMLRVGAMLKKWKAYLAELTFSMNTLLDWEIKHRVPEKWAAIPAYDYDNPHIFPLKTINSAGEKENRSLTPLFIPLSKHVIKLHEEGFDEEWFDLWDRLKPDPEKYAPYHLPLERPWPYKDIALRKKTGENRE
ncbi:hypothetical protein D1P53_000405 [Cryptococcus gattii VGV]|nr:hypothetical protein D1P53_000405 [Cryptococcus gattii VGV]